MQYGYGKQVEEWKTMAVITLSIDFSEENSYEKKDLNLLLFAAHNMTQEPGLCAAQANPCDDGPCPDCRHRQ